MANAKITHQINQAQLGALLNSHDGGIARDLYRRGIRVQNQAKLNLEKHPRRVDTGTLRSSINLQFATVDGHLAVLVLTNIRYAIYVHDGTGLYGPFHSVIKPVRAKRMRWRSRTTGRWVYARQTRGMEPNPFLRDALIAAKG